MNNRKHRRIQFDREIKIDTVDGKSSSTKANDISTSGIGLVADKPRIKGELIRLTFDLVQHGKKREVNIAGEVKHVQENEHGYILGVRFL